MVWRAAAVRKRMKAWNKRVYYVAKYLLIGGVVATFLATAFA
jgi:beta-hydroxylase